MTKAVTERKWHIVDAKGKILGRLATKIAAVLRGKHKVDFVPHRDCGDFVIVINAKEIKMTGKKWTDKLFHSHSRFPGGLKSVSAETIHAKDGTELMRRAVYGMLPKNRLRKDMISKLKIYAGPEHPHSAQNPTPLK